MKMSIAVFSLYFGKLPSYFPVLLKSFKNNDIIDWYIVTDDITYQDLPINVKIVKSNLQETKNKIQKFLPEVQIVLDTPYKLCDYKPVWGLIYPEIINNYDFWGYCDLDMIFGDIQHFITNEILENYDKIYQLGHFTLYRNTDENNKRFRMKAPNAVYYKDAFNTKEICVFDEVAGMQNIFDYYKFSTYKSRDYADISGRKYRFTLSNLLLSPKEIEKNNYDKQVFCYENGKILRYYEEDGKILSDEFIYIHFSKRKMPMNNISKDCNSMFITYKGLFPKDGSIKQTDFETYNPIIPKEEKKRAKQVKANKRKELVNYYWRIVQKKIKTIFKRGK